MDAKRIPFSPEDEERIASVGLWGLIAAITSIASAVVTMLVSVLSQGGAEMARGVVGLVLNLILAGWLLQASLAFRKVATTDEADQRYLLLGFSKLRSYFMMTGILIFIGVGLVVLFLVGGLTCGAMMRGR